MNPRSRLQLLLAPACILATPLASCQHHPAALEKDVTPVHVTVVESLSSPQARRYSASILPNRQVTLAFKTGGFVESLHQVRGADGRTRSADLGDLVAAGTVLATVRTTDYQLQVSQAEGQHKQASDAGTTARAQLSQAEAAAAKAEADFQRADTLYKKTSLTRSDYDAAKANRDSTRAQVNAAHSQVDASTGSLGAAQAALGAAQLSLHDTSLQAPFTGVIVQRSIEDGALAGPGVPAFVLADVASVKATFAVPDFALAQLKSGARLSVYTEAFPDRQFQGFVSLIAGAADSNSRSFQIEITIRNANAMLRPGMIVSLDVGPHAQSKIAAVAPLSAIVRASDPAAGFAVVTVDGNIAHLRPVTLGNTYGDRIAISGVQPGVRIVSTGATLITDGDGVEVIP